MKATTQLNSSDKNYLLKMEKKKYIQVLAVTLPFKFLNRMI